MKQSPRRAFHNCSHSLVEDLSKCLALYHQLISCHSNPGRQVLLLLGLQRPEGIRPQWVMQSTAEDASSSQRPAVAVTLSSQNRLLLVLFAQHKGGNVLGGAQHVPPYRGWRESQMSREFWVFVCLFPRWTVMAFTTSHGCPCACAPSPSPIHSQI